MKIDINKIYKTRHGQPVKLYEVLENSTLNYPVHGAYLASQTKDDWLVGSWTIDGRYNRTDGDENPFDLVEITEAPIDSLVPQHDQVIWVWNVSPGDAVPRHFAGFRLAGLPILCYVDGCSSKTAKDGSTQEWAYWSLEQPQPVVPIEINGRQITPPVREGDIYAKKYYVVFLGCSDLFKETTYVSKGEIAKGLVHLTPEAAKAHAEALLSFTMV